MKPREPRESGQHDMFRSRLDQILDMGHEKVILSDKIDWQFLSDRMGGVYTDGPGHPPLSNRLMAGLHILKYAEDLSDDEVCARWLENPYYQYFCGEEFFCHSLPLDRSSMTRWRQRISLPSGPTHRPTIRDCAQNRAAARISPRPQRGSSGPIVSSGRVWRRARRVRSGFPGRRCRARQQRSWRRRSRYIRSVSRKRPRSRSAVIDAHTSLLKSNVPALDSELTELPNPL